jgi:murein DD-endopeptidase MepM/ murein hydrolase activator NlpD
MGRVARSTLLCVAAAAVALAIGCSGGPKGKGAWHTVRAGETLWRLSQRYDTTVDAIRDANDGVDAHALRVGQRLWIPRRGAQRPKGATVRASSPPPRIAARDRAGDASCQPLARDEQLDFEWPVLGRLTSPYGERGGEPHDGIDLRADAGTPIQAAEAGKVVYAGDELGDYGKVIVIKHMGRWATVYAHNKKHLVNEGDFVEKGDVIAEVGDTGNASAPHLHFEVRRNNAPRDPQTCLP